MADDIKHPRVDETTIGFERALSGTMRLSLTGVWRDNKNFVNSVQPVGAVAAGHHDDDDRASRSRSTTGRTGRRRAPTTSSGTSRASSTSIPNGSVIGTVDPFRKYRAFMAVLNKRYTNRWQAQVSYVCAKATGNVDNTQRGAGGDAAVRDAEPGAGQRGR